MPELPEVETIRTQLLSGYRGETFLNITVDTPALLKNCTAAEFSQALLGKTIDDITRSGKYIIFHCSGIYPVVHLGMSGIFLSNMDNSLYPQHIHVKFKFASGKTLYYQDVRKFGKILLYDKFPQLPNVGIDPLNGGLSLSSFKKLLSTRKMNVKHFLMNQAIIAGIGNIYASEILYRALISPYRNTSDLKDREISALYSAINQILKAAIEKFGTTYSTYRVVSGESGNNQNFLKVYQKHNNACERCGEPIKKIVWGGRSTFFCARCQR